VNNIDPKFEVYARFLTGESEATEQKSLENQLAKDPDEKKSFEKLKSFWHNYNSEVDKADTIWEKTSEKLEFDNPQHLRPLKPLTFYKYAAAAILIISLSINSYYLINKWFTKPVEMIEYTAKKGEVKEFLLPDGSKVWLNSESTLILPEKFEGNNRNVYLIGQAFFKVEKNPHKPFLVNASQLVIKVLGTSFEVENYQNDPKISASLVEGKVQVIDKSTNKEWVVLKPSEEAIFNKSDGEIIVSKKPVSLVAPWLEGCFRFRNTDLLSIAHQLERKYDCEFVFVDEAAESLRFTADFENESLDEILELLNKAHSLNLKKSGRKYIVSTSE
jgi:ferric-dicitrate binding protein FerR (iron transport regulator)